MSRKIIETGGHRWVELGIVSSEQYGQIMSLYSEKKHAVGLIPILGSIPLGLGLISFIMSENMSTGTSSVWVRNRFRLLIGLVLVQAIFLIGVALSFYAVGWFGKEIRLQTAPIVQEMLFMAITLSSNIR